jgi:hypothetical protein
MKKTLTLILITLFAVACNISVARFDKVNEHKGDIILQIRHDSVGDIDAYTFFVKDTLGDINKLIINPDYAQFFVEGDTL